METNLNRREFLAGAAAGSLVIGFPLQAAAQGSAMPAEINAWVVVQPDERVIIRIARSEMGQGTLTGLAQLVAEELECDWARVSTEYPTPGQNLARKRVWGQLQHRRQPRHSRQPGVRAQGRRGRPHDAGAGGGRRVEGARR